MCGKVSNFAAQNNKKMAEYKSYSDYRKTVVTLLATLVGKKWEDGIWRRTGTPVQHILPTIHTDSSRQNRENRANAIKDYLGFDCKKCLGNTLAGLHQYAHHLNSSQALCMMFFSNLIDETHRVNKGMVGFVREMLSINISTNARYHFEYTEKRKPYIFNVSGKDEYEGTSFDFYIVDEDIEIYFEIKLTENGFGKAEDDSRHNEKIYQYKKLLPSYLIQEPTDEQFRNHYQIFRNIIRTGENKYVIFITDKNNPSTEKEKMDFQKSFGQSDNVKFITWQDIKRVANCFYPCKLPYQFDIF